MFRFLLLLVTVTAITAIKTKKEIRTYEKFLNSTQIPAGQLCGFQRSAACVLDAEEHNGRFEGDILLSEKQKSEILTDYAIGARRNMLTRNYFWPNNVLVYEIVAYHFNERQINAIYDGIRDIESQSCMKFRLKNAWDRNYVSITGFRGGCYASLGFQGVGVQPLNLTPNSPENGCFRHGTIVHELLHTIGFVHMHSTYNRDDWIRIKWNNIQPDAIPNFHKVKSNAVTNFGLDYDYGSCLHYELFAFTVNGRQTIVPREAYSGTIGQRFGMSYMDIFKLNIVAECPGYEKWRLK